MRGNTKYTYSLTFRTDHSGTDSRVTDNRVLGPLGKFPTGNIDAAGGLVVITSLLTSPGLVWKAALSDIKGFTLGPVTGSGSASSVDVLVGLNPRGSARSSTLTATAMWPNERLTSQTTITQNASTFTSAISPTTKVPPAGALGTITITGTPGLTYDISGGDNNFYLVNSSDKTGTIPPGGSKKVQFKINPQPKGAPTRSSKFTVLCTIPETNFSPTIFTIDQEKGLTDVRARGYVTTAGDGTNLLAGMYCVGMYGGYNGTRYTKALYIDKRGYNQFGINPGTGDDPKEKWATIYSNQGLYDAYDGLGNCIKITAIYNTPAADYCDGKQRRLIYLPAIRQFIDGIWVNRSSLPDEWAFPENSAYWSSTEGQGRDDMAFPRHPGAPDNDPWWSDKKNLFHVRCVAEY